MLDSEDSLNTVCGNLSDSTLQVLREMYGGCELWGTGSPSPHRTDGVTRISVAQGAALHKLIWDNRVTRSLEIGLAMAIRRSGFSMSCVTAGTRCIWQ